MNRKTKIFSGKFILGLVIYALVFLVLVGVGLGVFWKFIEAYELSRPKNAISAYVDQLTPEAICAASDDLYAIIDQGLQDRSQFDQIIQDALTGNLTYAKKSSESTDKRQVYVLRSGRTAIGTFAIEAGEEDKFGFRRWQVTDTEFDLSFLKGEGIQVTVPSEYVVKVNGVALDTGYQIQTGIEYSALEQFYGDYNLPTMVTYAVTDYLGDVTMEITDASGNPVSITSDMDMNTLLPVCSAEQDAAIQGFTKRFVDLWVAFSGSTNETKGGNYWRLKEILSSDGVLAERLYSALDGLTFGQSNGATIQNITINRSVPLEEGTYMCDLTYVVSTVGRKGAVETVTNMKLILVAEAGNLRLKAMEQY